MTETEVEQVVLAVVRQYTQNESAAASSRFEEDLRLRERGREMLFASLASAFAARGVSLPSRGFMLSQFLTCPTPAAVRDSIREKVFGAAPPARPASGASRETTQEPARPAAGEAEREAPSKRKAKTPAKPAAKRKPVAKKSAPAAKPRRAKKR